MLYVLVSSIFDGLFARVIYGILACQRLVKKLMEKYCQGRQHRGYTPPPQWPSSDSTDWPPSGGNIELPTTGELNFLCPCPTGEKHELEVKVN